MRHTPLVARQADRLFDGELTAFEAGLRLRP
jgi:hypothetical protein